MKSKNIIIGGGISGLIFAHYNPEFHLISIQLGGLLNQESDFGSMTLWDTPETRKLLEDLGLEIKPRREQIHYFFNGKIYEEAPEVLRREYIQKKMGELNKHLDFKDLALSTEKTNYIDALEVDFEKIMNLLTEELKRRNNYENKRVYEISDDFIIVGDEKEKRYFNTLISTIPAPIFWKMWNGNLCREQCKELEFLFTPATYISMEKIDGLLKKILIDSNCLKEDFEQYIYFLDDQKFHRVSRTSSGKYIIQFSNRIDRTEASKILEVSPTELKDTYQKIGQFVSHKGNAPPNNIMFLGRHAQWDYKIKVQDIVRVARYSKFMFETMRNRQTRFNKNFIEFNKLSFKDKQELTEKFILYVISELNELLNETNWKLHRSMKEIKREKIVEEYIDIFKFVLGMADIWGITNTEIFNGFMEKTKIVEERFRKEIGEKNE